MAQIGVEATRPFAVKRGRPALLDVTRRRRLIRARFVADLLALMLALMLATATRFGREAIKSQTAYGKYLWLFLILWLVSLGIAGAYSRHAVDDATEEFKDVINGSLLGVAVAVTGSFIVNFDISRIWLFLAVTFGGVFVMLGRVFVRGYQVWLRKQGRLLRRVVVVGTDRSGYDLARYVERVGGNSILVVGFVHVPGSTSVADPERILGSSEQLAAIVSDRDIAEVIVAPSVTMGSGFGSVVSALDGVPVELVAAPGAAGFLPSRVKVLQLGDRPMLHLERNELLPWARATKRLMDLAFGIPLTVLALPVIVLCATAVKIDSRGPVFFRQSRAGVKGRPFKIWKLRTMGIDAESQRAAVIASMGGDARLFKADDDPRVTRVGRLLRKTSLDELPQLFNVVAGQMSLVGPRPPIFEEVDGYSAEIRRRLHVKPGMTGLWQVKGRHALDFDDYVEQDLLYVQSWSITLDLVILLRTIPAVLRMRGAS